MSWPSDAVPGGGTQNSNRFSLTCRTNSDEIGQIYKEFRADERNSGLFRRKSDLFRGI
jgi:hypothetical protein